MEQVVYVDGKFYPASDAKVSVFDHGLLYGDGVFEGIRAYNKRVFKLERHMERMYQSAKAIDLKIPHARAEFIELILQTCRRNNIVDGYIRPIVTRGPGDLGLDPRKCKRGPSVIIIAQPSIALYPKEKYEQGLKLVTSSYRRVPPQSLSPSIKSLNYLNQNHSVMTPPTSTNLPGVTRETVLELAEELGIRAVEKPFTLYDVWASSEAFITGTAAEIGPVVELDGRAIGDGKPGKVTKQLMKAFRELVTTTGTSIY